MKVRVIEKEGKFLPEYYKDNMIGSNKWINCSANYHEINYAYDTLEDAKDACLEFVKYIAKTRGTVVWEQEIQINSLNFA